MKPFTVKELYTECKKQIDKGNADKVIMISDDEEGNGYHYMWYAFSSVEDVFDCNSIDERIATKEDTIILG